MVWIVFWAAVGWAIFFGWHPELFVALAILFPSAICIDLIGRRRRLKKRRERERLVAERRAARRDAIWAANQERTRSRVRADWAVGKTGGQEDERMRQVADQEAEIKRRAEEDTRRAEEDARRLLQERDGYWLPD
ncbi:hypothetical protein [Actinomadura rubrisoli]|uniref:Uncharacterized protein n=1 Tax=Actinomadura rubrisoli TaxID=2530368 RepID=A0A4R5AFZ5_9ACTN|nr:hypothetical protein [Actinomadura rubrisoli]TDD71513.1 hypothetical protein E1298_35620 [Actinomadura rubrisoli]